MNRVCCFRSLDAEFKGYTLTVRQNGSLVFNSKLLFIYIYVIFKMWSIGILLNLWFKLGVLSHGKFYQ